MGMVKEEMVIIVHKDGRKEEHIIDPERGCGTTAIGFAFYSKTIQNYIMVHPQSVEKIIHSK